jgi:hypothetical protein
MTGPERRAVIVAIDVAVRERLKNRRECSRCTRELEHDEFSQGRQWCKTCEATRVREYRRREAA